MSKISTAKALLNRSVRKSAPLTAGQKAAATKARIKMERIAAEQAAIAAYQAMTPGQKAAHTKRQAAKVAPAATPAPVAAAPAAPVPVATPALAYADMTAGQKAAYTKRFGKPVAAAPVATPAPAAPVAAAPAAPVPTWSDIETLNRLISLAPALKAAGLI